MKRNPLAFALRAALAGGALAFGLAGPVWAEDAKELYQAGKVAAEQNDVRTAVIQLKSSLQEDPDFGPARALLGKLYLRNNDPAAAEKELRRASGLGVAKAEWAVPLGKALLMQGKADEVPKLLKVEAGDNAATKADVLIMLGSAQMIGGKREEGRKLMLEAQSLNPGGVEVNLSLARLALFEQNLPQSLVYVETALKTDPKSYDAWMGKGDVLAKQGKLPEAKLAFQTAIDLDPNNVFGRLGRAGVLIDANELDAAMNDINFVAQQFPNFPMVSYLRGKVLFKQKKLDQAEEALQEVLKREPNHLFSNLMLGYIYFQKGQYQMAESSLKLFTKAVPNHSPATRLLAATYIAERQPDKAIPILEKLVEKSASDTQLLVLLASAHMGAQHYAQASDYMQRAVELEPDAAKLRAQLALMQIRGGETEDAVQNLEQVVQLDPKLVQADVVLVAALVQQGQHDKALEAAQALVKRDDKNPVGHNLLGLAQLAKGERDQAKASFEVALSRDAGFLPAEMNLTRMDLTAKQWDAAQQRVDRILSKDPKHTEGILARYFILDQRGQRDEATEWLAKSWNANPGSMPLGAALCNTYLARKDYLKALAVANEIQGKHPQSPDSYRLLGTALLADGKYASAISNFRKALELGPNNLGSLQLLASAERASGEPKAALKTYDRMLAVDEKSLPALMGKAEIDMQLKNYDGVLATAERLKKAYPKMPLGFQAEGDVLMARNQLDTAQKAYEEAMSRQGTTQLVLVMSELHQRAGRPDQALAIYTDWLGKHPDDQRARFAYGSQLQQQGKGAQAITEYLKVLEKEPKNLVVLNNLVWLLQESADARARDYAEKLAALEPQLPEIQDTLGWVLVQQNQTERGLQYLEKAASAAPKVPEIRYHLAVAYDRTGRGADAKGLLDKLLAETPSFDGRTDAEALQRKLSGAN